MVYLPCGLSCECADLNTDSHTWHLYGFSPLWILLCLTRWLDLINRLLQTLHSNGFSPEWLRLCTARCLLDRQHLPHSVHLYLPAWIFVCVCRPLGDEKRFSHWAQEYTFSPVCVLLCIFKFWRVVYRLWHIVHKYGLVVSRCRCSVMSLLSASVLISDKLPANTQCSFNVNDITWQFIKYSLVKSCQHNVYVRVHWLERYHRRINLHVLRHRSRVTWMHWSIISHISLTIKIKYCL